MSENNSLNKKKSFSPDWLVRGVLTKLGETFDKLTGRNWKPSSSLATSELNERIKKLLDSKVKTSDENGGRFVPHHIKLKMQWDKFSTDSENSLKLLENELLAGTIDHINDNRYHTFAPVKVEVKTDYFTDGVDLYVGFDDFDKDEAEEIIKVTLPQADLKNIVVGTPAPLPEPVPESEKIIVQFKVGGNEKQVELEFFPSKRLQVGRTKENDLIIDDASISKIHASLVLNRENQLMVADTGSTNGTFINNQRIAYGKAFMIGEADKMKFGTVEIFFRRVPKPVVFETRDQYETEILPENRQNVSNTSVINQQSMPIGNYTTNKEYSEIADEKNEAQNATTGHRIDLNFDEPTKD